MADRGLLRFAQYGRGLVEMALTGVCSGRQKRAGLADGIRVSINACMRILFITSSYVGDGVLSTGVLDHLLRLYPEARMWVACGPGPAPLFRVIPGVDRVLVMKKRPYAGHWRTLLRAVWRVRWDMVVDIRGSATAFLLRAGRRYVLRPDPGLHRVVHLGKLLGLQEAPPSPRVWLTEAAQTRAQKRIPDGERVLAVGPTANWPGKIWPVERYIALAQKLTASDGPLPGARIMVEGGPGEREHLAPLYAAFPAERLIDEVGSDLVSAAACLGRAALYVGNDSGLMHLAAAAGAPTLGLFGPTREALYAPWGARARFVRGPRSCEEIIADPAYDSLSPDLAMRDLTVARVLDAAVSLLSSVPGSMNQGFQGTNNNVLSQGD